MRDFGAKCYELVHIGIGIILKALLLANTNNELCRRHLKAYLCPETDLLSCCEVKIKTVVQLSGVHQIAPAKAICNQVRTKIFSNIFVVYN